MLDLVIFSLLCGAAFGRFDDDPYGKEVHHYSTGYSHSYSQANLYRGVYYGKCDADGFYYQSPSSFVQCSNGNAFQQKCAPGSANSDVGRYVSGNHYHSNDFCDVNLVDYGYADSYHAPHSHGVPHGAPHVHSYGSPYVHSHGAPHTRSQGGYSHTTSYAVGAKNRDGYDGYRYNKGYGQETFVKKESYGTNSGYATGYGKHDGFGPHQGFGKQVSYAKHETGYGTGYGELEGYTHTATHRTGGYDQYGVPSYGKTKASYSSYGVSDGYGPSAATHVGYAHKSYRHVPEKTVHKVSVTKNVYPSVY